MLPGIYKIIGYKSLNLTILFHLAFMFYLCDGIFCSLSLIIGRKFFTVVYLTSFTTSQHMPYLGRDISNTVYKDTLVLPIQGQLRNVLP